MTKEVADSLADELRRKFTAHVDVDEVRPGRYRFEVYSKHFGDASQLARHDQAWAVAERVLNEEELQDLSLLLLIGPEDVDESLVALMP